MPTLTLILILVAVLFVTLAAILRRYRRCPSDKILVIYGKTGRSSSARCVHGGAAFIWPVFQDYAYLDLKRVQPHQRPLQAEHPRRRSLPLHRGYLH